MYKILTCAQINQIDIEGDQMCVFSLVHVVMTYMKCAVSDQLQFCVYNLYRKLEFWFYNFVNVLHLSQIYCITHVHYIN